jgi:hypothetical protein
VSQCDTSHRCHTCDICLSYLKYHYHVSLVIKSNVPKEPCINKFSIKSGGGGSVGQKVVSRPSADSFEKLCVSVKKMKTSK